MGFVCSWKLKAEELLVEGSPQRLYGTPHPKLKQKRESWRLEFQKLKKVRLKGSFFGETEASLWRRFQSERGAQPLLTNPRHLPHTRRSGPFTLSKLADVHRSTASRGPLYHF